MKRIIKSALLCTCLLPIFCNAQEQEVDYNLYPDYSPRMYPDYGLLPSQNSKEVGVSTLPDHVNNAETPYFPPVFNQAGGSCSAASRIGYMFTHEINSFRDKNGKLMVNRYPSHFVWLMTNGNSGKYALVQHVGVPNAAIYGGATYSHLFGNQTAFQNNFGWMQGYDKWYSAMFNRMLQPAHFPLSLKSEEGRMALKHWLYNHNGDNSYKCGGVAGIGVGINGKWGQIPPTPTNDAIGVSGKKFVQSWGTKFNHALTIVGYDDRIEFDLDHNGIMGEKDKDEVGAWIIVNSWGSGFANKGFIYCPYAYAGKTFKKGTDGLYFSGNWWFPEVFKVNKNYRPLRTIKVEMDYSHRSEICLSAGISSDLSAIEPERTIPLHHFQYAGDGKKGKTNPAPAVPMLGKWADGKLHTEPMEFGYDLTSLSSYFSKNKPLKYFFIIETRDWAQGTGKIRNASIIDYEFDKEGVEVPFTIDSSGVTIENKGKRTIISTIVSGESYYEPQNFSLNGKHLSWQAPLASVHPLSGYLLYADNNLLATLPSGTRTYDLSEKDTAYTYSLSALYHKDITSPKVSVNATIAQLTENQCAHLEHSGFIIPHIFESKYEEATIEFWMRPLSLVDYNQGAGPGWNDGFKIHSSSTGNFVAGWDQENRASTPAGTLKVGEWTHIAIVVKKNVMTIYVNGKPSANVTTNSYNGIGGYDDFDFGSNENENNIDADIDELRIWNYARNASEIESFKQTEFGGNVMPKGLLVYYKGAIATLNNSRILRDFAGVNHARFFNHNCSTTVADGLSLSAPTGNLSLKINALTQPVYCGLPVKMSANYTDVVNDIVWQSADADINELHTASPSLTFNQMGKHAVTAIAFDSKGQKVSDTYMVDVVATPSPNAEFSISHNKISAGEHITFIARHPLVGYRYEWSMPGATTEKANSVNAATTYTVNGHYQVKLTVTAPDGKQATSQQDIEVVEVAPKANFDVSPSVIVKGESVLLKDLSKYKPTAWKWLFHSNNKDIIVYNQAGAIIPTSPGVYDIKLNVNNKQGSDQLIRPRGLIVCNADSKNGLLFTSNTAQIKLISSPLKTSQQAATIDWWMNPGEIAAECNGIGQEGTLMIKTNGNGALSINIANQTYNSTAELVKENEWHHYAITFDAGNITFYRDGRAYGSTKVSITALPVCKTLVFGGSKYPFHGEIDEFRIWLSALNEPTLRKFANEPITDVAHAMQEHQLALYYDFNQSGGNVLDRTSHHYDGLRMNFGPDGDAWGLSQGVFCLNFENEGMQDVAALYLKNYQKPFRTNGNQLVNPNQAPRFYAIADWTIENATITDNVTTTVHVDKQKSDGFTMTSGWDGFGDLINHKIYQTVTLPAGSYTFVADYAQKNNAGKCGDSYLVAAKGKGLPDTNQINQALGATAMHPKSKVNMSNQVQFVLKEETEVSLGLVVNMRGQLCAVISKFHLYRNDAEFLEAQSESFYDLTIDASGSNTLFLPYAATLPENVAAYTLTEVNEGTAYITPLENNVIPANTGVIIKGQPGTYRFHLCAPTTHVNSLLTGVLKDTSTDTNKKYYQIEGDRLQLLSDTSLKANHAYFVSESNDSHAYYVIEQIPTGIKNINAENSSTDVFDISGHHIDYPTKGLYIVKGKKIYK